MNVALVYDRVNKFGGAERLLLELHALWPEAPLYTAIYDAKKAPWADKIRVIPSFLQKTILPKDRHEWYPFLMPFAFESFIFDDYDVIISLTSAEAKGIITKAKTLHISYLLTPPRYLWTESSELPAWAQAINAPFSKANLLVQSALRNWDFIASTRPDHILTISQDVAKRVQKYYHQHPHVIYPPIDCDFFRPGTTKPSDYFLAVGRLVPAKRFDILIQAFNYLGWPLKLIGQGLQEKYLKREAKANIHFVNKYLTDAELLGYYQGCQALVVPGKEDFGLVALEALACGKPVIAFAEGGIAEILEPGKVGRLFSPQTAEALQQAIRTMRGNSYSPAECRRVALQFRQSKFRQHFSRIVDEYFRHFSKKNESS